ncbi:MAG: murein biosynthesis integral membrane protein MurJ [Anaerolineaceae bacterium]|nr:murein biosynthesis integral membrane protein MurJ [Anaerolineaceae bacterium]
MKRLVKSTLIISFFFGIDKILSFVRQLFIAREFALSYELDVFNAANNIPDLLSALISGGALAVAFIPVLSDYLETKGRKEVWQLFSNIINLAFLSTCILAILIFLFTPWLITNIIVPGFPTEQKQLAIELMRFDLIAIIIFSISGLVMSGLQANQHFLLPAIAPGMYNIGQIFGVAILAPSKGLSIGPLTLPAFGLGIHGLVYGVIIGAAMHLLIQIPGLIKYQFRWEPKLRLKSAGVKQVLRLLGPRITTMFFIQMFFIIRDSLASGMGEGAVTALNLGWFIMQVPESLVGTAIAMALLPTISTDFAAGRLKEFREKINISINTIITLTIPIAVFTSIGLTPLVEVAFNYSDADTQRVVLAAQIYLAGIVGHSLLEVAARAFYAQQKPKIPLIAAALNAAAYFALSQLLSRWFGFSGIAWANSIIFTTQAILLLVFLNRGHNGFLEVKKTFTKILIFSLCYGAFLFLAMHFLSFIPSIYTASTGIALGFLLSLFVMRKELIPLLHID